MTRPLIQMPTWDGKIVLAGILIVGYYALVLLIGRGTADLPPTRASALHDAMLTLGPPIGLVFGALFRNTAAEERREALRSSELRTAIETPGAAPLDQAPPAPTAPELKQAVEAGAAAGTEAGVTAGLAGSDRVDHGRFPQIDEMLAADAPPPADPAATPEMKD